MKKWVIGTAAGMMVLGALFIGKGGPSADAAPSRPAIQFNGGTVTYDGYPDCH